MMSNTAREIYIQVVRDLSPIERLRLANIILNELVQQNIPVLDVSDTWTEQDKIDVTNFSLQYAATLFTENEEI